MNSADDIRAIAEEQAFRRAERARREALVLRRHTEGLTPTEIAQRCGLPPSTVRSIVKRELAEVKP